MSTKTVQQVQTLVFRPQPNVHFLGDRRLGSQSNRFKH